MGAVRDPRPQGIQAAEYCFFSGMIAPLASFAQTRRQDFSLPSPLCYTYVYKNLCINHYDMDLIVPFIHMWPCCCTKRKLCLINTELKIFL